MKRLLNSLRSPLLVVAGLLLAGSVAAAASSITYYFQGALPFEGVDVSIQGSFALDMAVAPSPVGTAGAFHFDAYYPGGNSTFLDSTVNQGLWTYDDAGGIALEFVNQDDDFAMLLDFASLPGPLNLQGFSVGGQALFSGLITGAGVQGDLEAFTSGEADTTPEPPSWTLMLGGLLAAGLGWNWRRHAAGLQA